jgi:hypothetical protein
MKLLSVPGSFENEASRFALCVLENEASFCCGPDLTSDHA